MLKTIVLAVAFSTAPLSAAYAQQCLHGQGETPDQAARRRDAVTATRMIHTIQANQPGAATRERWSVGSKAGASLTNRPLSSSGSSENIRTCFRGLSPSAHRLETPASA